MKIRAYFANLKIATRISIIFISVLLIIFIILGIIISKVESTKLHQDADVAMNAEVTALTDMIDLQVKKNMEKLEVCFSTAKYYLANQGNFSESNKEVEYNAINQITKDKTPVKVNEISLGGTVINNNFNTVDHIKEITTSEITIFEKMPLGYIRIATTVKKENGDRAIGTYISNDSPIIKAIEQGQTYKGRAFVVSEWYIAIYEPIKINGVVKGILFSGIKEKDLNLIKEKFNARKIFENGYPYLVDKAGILIIHPKIEGKSIADQEFFQYMLKNQDEKVNGYRYQWEGKWKFQYFKFYAPIQAFIAVTFYEDDITAIVRKMQYVIGFVMIIGILIMLFVVFKLSKSITNSLKKVLAVTKEIANGNLNVDITITSKDEVGELLEGQKNMIEKLKEIIRSVIKSSDHIASASAQMSSSSQQVSEGATNQASSAEEISSSIEEMASNIQQNTDNSRQTESISIKAAEGIKESNEAVSQTALSMREIASKVSIISDIAFQTNILALNAAVEAARAGEQGKGFAVVAAEVRKLAERSQIAAGEINSLTSKSVDIADKSGKLLTALVPDIERTSKLVQEITAASLEQSTGADQINNAITQLNQVTQENAASAEEMATSSEELASQAEILKEAISFFKIDEEEYSKNPIRQQPTKQIVQPAKKTITRTPKPMGNSSSGINLNMGSSKNDDLYERF